MPCSFIDEFISEFRLYEGYIHIINHSGIIDLILSKLPQNVVDDFLEVFKQSTRMSWDKCSSGLAEKTGVSQRFIDVLGTLATQCMYFRSIFLSKICYERLTSYFQCKVDIESARTKLEETFPNDLDKIRTIWKECKEVMSHVYILGTKRKCFLAPLFVISTNTYDGIYFRTCVFGRKKHVLAEGGR